MKLRIQVEDRAYEVDVDFLGGAPPVNGKRRAATAIPASVLRPRVPHKLPEDTVCRCPMAGRVVAVLADCGRTVRRNEPVVLIEAMKMQIPIGPAVDGVLKTVHVTTGDAVGAGQVLFELS